MLPKLIQPSKYRQEIGSFGACSLRSLTTPLAPLPSESVRQPCKLPPISRASTYPRYQWPNVFVSSPRTIMSAVPSASTSHSNFLSVFNAALQNYKHRTKEDLSSHPLLPSLQSCDTPEAILAVLQEKIPAFSQSQNDDNGLTKWVAPTINVLHSFSATLGGGIGPVGIRVFPCEEFRLKYDFQAFPPANLIFTGIGVLLLVSVLRGSFVQPIL